MRDAVALAVFLGISVGAVAVVVSALRRWRRDRVLSPLWSLGLAGALLTVVYVGLVMAGSVMPDDFDNLPRAERRATGPALDASVECGSLPFIRVMEVEVIKGQLLRYRCGWTPFGFPSFSNEATCGDGQWLVPGWNDVRNAGHCS